MVREVQRGSPLAVRLNKSTLRYEKIKSLVEPEEIDPSLYEAEDLG